MSFHRYNTYRADKMSSPSRAGSGLAANFLPKAYAAETDETITTTELAGGLIHQGTTLTSDVIYTLPTSALLQAETGFDSMDVGDAYSFVVNNSQAAAFDVVIAVGTGQTAIGANNTLSVPPQGTRVFTLIKTSTSTFDLY